MNKLTGGRYSKLLLDKNFSTGARLASESVDRSVLYLSEGTADQLYLSLRLAMCDLLLDGDDPCPIILDDALASFDDARMEAVLDYLKELSATRQIILFTCHKRESAHFAGDSDVNIISL